MTKNLNIIINNRTINSPIRWRISKPFIKLYILRIKPSMNITSDKQIHMYFSFVGNACISEKSCNCIAVEKSKSIWVKLGHLFASSWRTVWVINSIGNSMYLNDDPKRTLKI